MLNDLMVPAIQVSKQKLWKWHYFLKFYKPINQSIEFIITRQ